MKQDSFLQHRILQAIALFSCILINILGSSTTIFPYTIGGISALYPTPITPHAITFSIWLLIFIQWIYDFFTYQKSLQPIEYLLNSVWVILFCNNYIILSYCILMIMTLRMIVLYKEHLLYTTWLCVASVLQSYIVGENTLLFFTVLIFTIIANPLGSLIRIINTSQHIRNKKAKLQTLRPALIPIFVLLWALVGISVS